MSSLPRRRLGGFAGAIVALCAAAGWLLWPAPVFSHNPTTTTVLFNREVSAVLQAKCLSCHGDATMAMSLATYADARPWAVAIKEEILARRMPPWSAERGYGDFANDAGLTAREIDFLVSWADGGAPEGDEPAPPIADHRAHWMHGEPDAVHTAPRPVTIAANSPLYVERIVIDPGLAGERWLRAIDFKPGDARVARAAFFSVEGTGEYLGGWTPSRPVSSLPDAAALRLPARSRIAIDVYYKGTDDIVADTPRIGLYYASGRPTYRAGGFAMRPPVARGPARRDPAEGPHRLGAAVTLRTATTVIGLRPELGSGGRSLEIRARRPDGSTEVLLWLRNYRPEWPTPYTLRQPVSLPAGSRIEATAYFEGPPAAAPSPAFTVDVLKYDGAASPRPSAPPPGQPNHQQH